MKYLLVAVLLGGPPSEPVFDHAPFDRLLRSHVVGGLVDYDAFGANPSFKGYLKSLAEFDPSVLAREDQLAFWINAYNAYTIELIIKHRERRSIRNINKKFGLFRGLGPWAEPLVAVGGKSYDLETVEQKIIRPVFREPRIHFALVCAAMGCPPLRSEAYRGDQLDRQLDDQARTFLAQSPEKNRVDVESKTVWVSEIFKFNDYAKDFGGSDGSIQQFIAKYHPAGPARDILLSGAGRLRYSEYDWTLNSQEQGRARQAAKDQK